MHTRCLRPAVNTGTGTDADYGMIDILCESVLKSCCCWLLLLLEINGPRDAVVTKTLRWHFVQ